MAPFIYLWVFLAQLFAAANGAPHCEKSKVLILGAGMAGVSAGNSLAKEGVHDFKIIEYQDRVGGRTLHTNFGKQSNGSPWVVELGTNWITGLHHPNGSIPGEGKYNPIWKLAEEVNLTTVNTRGGQELFNHNGLFDWSRALLDLQKSLTAMRKLADDRVKSGRQDVSARVGLGLVGWDSTNDIYKQAAEWLIWETDAASTVDLSSMIFGAIGETASEGDILGPFSRFVVDQRGYDLVTRHLASTYLKTNDPRLVLNSPVSKVSYGANGVIAQTENGACYQADYAICTFSLGVLQQSVNGQAPVSFRPEFPGWKAESILGNVMGIYTKIFYQFKPEDVFWPKHIQNYLYASPTRKGWWGLWESLDFPGSPLEGSGIIFSTMILEQSKQIELQTDDTTMQQGLKVLRQMFPNATIPEPEAFFYPRWGMTPWAYGSYSNWATGYTLEDHTNFRANLDRLWFAGEATSSEYWGYLHGAFYEGKFAGQEIAACVKQGKCSDRKRYVSLSGNPKRFYNETSGFQDPINKLVD